MQAVSDWMVVAGFFLILAGVWLRVTLMMRANDAVPADGTPLVAHAAVASFRAANPASKLPLVMWLAIAAGFLLLIAGFLLQLRQ